jgi:hypothetical protein
MECLLQASSFLYSTIGFAKSPCGWTVMRGNDTACGKATHWGWGHASRMWTSYMDIYWNGHSQCPENWSQQTCNLKLRFLISENMLSGITSSEKLSSATRLSRDPYHGILSLPWNLCWSPLVQTTSWTGSKIHNKLMSNVITEGYPYWI